MKRLGEKLKSERERRQLSLHEVGIHLKISPRILQSIEEGQRDKLPAKTFLRGFIRSYALHLKLNADEILQLFHEEEGSTHPIPAELQKSAAGTEPIPSNSQSSDEKTAGKKEDNDSNFSMLDPNIGSGIESKSNPQSKQNKLSQAEAETTNSKGSTKKDSSALSPSWKKDDSSKSKRRTGVESDETSNSNRVFVVLGIVALVSLIVIVSKLIEKYSRERLIEPAATHEIAKPSNSDQSALVSSSPEFGAPAGVNSSTTSPVGGDELKAVPTDVGTANTPEISSSNQGKKTESASNEDSKKLAVLKPSQAEVKPNDSSSVTVPAMEAKPIEKKKDKEKEKEKDKTKVVAAVEAKPSDAVDTNIKADAPTEKKTENKITEVILEGKEDVEITYKLSASSSEKTLKLSKNEYHTFRTKSEIELGISDGGAVRIFVDGKDRGLAGKSGQSVKLKYPK